MPGRRAGAHRVEILFVLLKVFFKFGQIGFEQLVDQTLLILLRLTRLQLL